ncbi:MAG: hypothetical protein ACKVQU_02180 [Burkholderiales bacterium]
MSVITELLDRLSGIAIVKERLSETLRRVEQLGERVLEHDRRLTRIETVAEISMRSPKPALRPQKK